MDRPNILDEGSSQRRQTVAPETESLFNVRNFAAAAHYAVERLAGMLSRDDVEGVHLQRPADLMASARSSS